MLYKQEEKRHLSVRIPKYLHTLVKKSAVEEGITMEQIVTEALIDILDKDLSELKVDKGVA